MIALILAAQVVVDPGGFAAKDAGEATAYFSPDSLTRPVRGCKDYPKRPAVSDFEAGWYSSVWIRANEPSLATSPGASSLSTWRFTEIPSFTAPTIFRISEGPDGRLRMIAKRLSGKGGYDPGVVKDKVERVLTSGEQSRFRKALALLDNVLAGRSDDCLVVLDGSKLILERTTMGQYLVGQRDREEGQPMAEMSALLSGFAGWGR